jgi:hypothetical protein
VLDMVFDEDQSRIRDRNAATNLALLRKLGLALLKREQSDPRMSIKMKRRRVGWDNDYLFTVLAAVARASSHPSPGTHCDNLTGDSPPGSPAGSRRRGAARRFLAARDRREPVGSSGGCGGATPASLPP